MKFSKKELIDLIKAWFFISLAFAILETGFRNLFSYAFFFLVGISALTVGIAFLLHEIMHKFVAQRYGYFAEFKAFDKMLFLALIMSFFGFIIVLPGAVFIQQRNITREKNGKISLAGPLTNIILASLFLIPTFFFQSGFFIYAFKINALLALFNLVPIMPFDGAKVLAWRKDVYFVNILVALVLFFLSYIL